jgi:hypothetical protein
MLEPPEVKRKRKRQFDFMTSDLLKERQMHLLASAHFGAWSNLVFVISATMTLIQAGLATVAQANLYSDVAQSAFNITIALLASISVFWQSFVKHWDYGGKATLHESASSALEKIYNVALLRAREETANIYCGGGTTDGLVDEVTSPAETNNEEGEDNVTNESSNIFETLTKQFEQAVEHGEEVPMQIACAFQILDTRVGACKKEIVSKARGDNSIQDGCRVRWEKIYPALYQTLTATITNQPGWPYFLPNAEKVVDKAMVKFQNLDANLLGSLLERNRTIDENYRAFAAAGSSSNDGAVDTTPLIDAEVA